MVPFGRARKCGAEMGASQESGLEVRPRTRAEPLRMEQNQSGDLAKLIASANAAFRGVSPCALRRLTDAAIVRTGKRGATVYALGERWDHLGLVIDGSLAMITSEGGARRRLYAHLKSGDFFGVSAVLDGEGQMAEMLVLSKRATYACFRREVVLDVCRSEPTIALALATLVAGRLRNVAALLVEQISVSVEKRIARFLVRFAQGPGMSAASEPLPVMTQAQIAFAAGTVKEVVARTVGQMESENALRREHGHIRYLDREKLAARYLH